MFARTFTFITLIAATASTPSVTTGLPGYTYIAVGGDTCYSIAARAGIDVTRLESANPGMNCNALLMIRERICIPSN
ncbi:hypothetical protein F5146DRAFT_1092523 [Armillaria mellea]|nr:hypothetical protein F5146DRAFT_1092523 [Armillaria mellea]